MRAGVIQSSYIPWRGYFDFIASVDVFVLYDDVAFGSKKNWRHCNQLKVGSGRRWTTVPVNTHAAMPIDEVEISGNDWVAVHRGLLRESLGRARYFHDAYHMWEESVGAGVGRLSTLNTRFIRGACSYLGIDTPIVDSRTYGAVGAKTDRLIDLLKKIGADVYLSGPSARDYIDPTAFLRAGIRLEYKSYDYAPYPQLDEPFIGTVSVLDLIANCGSDSRRYLRSRTPNEEVVL